MSGWTYVFIFSNLALISWMIFGMRSLQLWMRIFAAMALGLLTGLLIREQAQELKMLGEGFLNLVRMIIALLVFASMTVGVSSIHDPKKLGRVGLKTLSLYLGTTVLAILVGILFAKTFAPGVGMDLTSEQTITVAEPPNFTEMLLSLIPTNPLASIVSGNVLQIIVFSLFLGISINFAGEKGRALLEGIESLAEVMYKLTSLVMELAPIGVYGIIAWISGTFGSNVLLQLGKFIILYYATCILFVAVVFCGVLWFIARLDPIPFFRGMTDSIMVAFSTGSSSASLPVTIRCVQDKLGVSRNISSFVVPLGSTVNMNGTAIFQGMAALFISQAYGIDLDLTTIVSIVITATLSAVGTAGIPGSGFIMLTAVLSSAGLPLEGLAILYGVDRLRDMIGTVLNVLGDAVVAVTVAKNEGELDELTYYQSTFVELEGSEA